MKNKTRPRLSRRMAPAFAKQPGVMATGLAMSLLAAPLAYAQQPQPDQPIAIERIQVTGSSISRVQTESALPVTILSADDIAKTGVNNVADLIQMLPAMQGFVPASSGVNGGSGGVTTAALHALPSKYTLVLIDGQRVAPFLNSAVAGGGFGVNLGNIPLDAIERVEILTDGASALYGSDAIAGVVNFILKKNSTEGKAFFNYTQPQQSGGNGFNAGISKGIGNLDTDHYNIFFSYSHDYQATLNASQRSFSAQGAYFPFSNNGVNYIFNGATSNTAPANITFRAVPNGSPPGTAPTAYSINPYYTLNGNCGANAIVLSGMQAIGAVGDSCRFNYAATVMDIPEDIRNSGVLRGAYRINPDTTVWADVLVTSNAVDARYAPPAQPTAIGTAANRFPSLYNTYVAPYLTANNLAISASSSALATLGFRAVPAGGREDIFDSLARQISFGMDGLVAGWGYHASVTFSSNKLTDTSAGGFVDNDQFQTLVANGSYDPVLNTGASSLQSAVLHLSGCCTGPNYQSDLNTVHFGAQHDLFEMKGGTSIISLGADYMYSRFRAMPSSLLESQSGFSTQPASSDYPVGGGYGAVPFDASRDNWGAYGEWLLPVTKDLEVTASGRYDSYGRVYSRYQFSNAFDPVTGLQDQVGNQSVGNTFQDTTGKLSARWTPIQSVLLRASYGTGFKAPNLTDIAGALTFAGSTAGTYTCPFPGSAGCLPGSAQYDLLSGPNGLSGNAGLKPETSKQWTAGVRWEPIKNLSLGLDLWDVKIINQVLSQGIAEQVAFNNPQTYKSLFIDPYMDPAGFTTIGFQQLPFNGGVAEYQGIDWDFTYRTATPWGKLAAAWTGTYMIKQEYNFGPGLPFNTDLGQYGPDQAVVFRVQSNVEASLATGAFTNTVLAHYKSGYKDEGYATGGGVFLANPNGTLGNAVAFCCLQVPSYTTFDWQGAYAWKKNTTLVVGIKNLFDKSPPLSLQTGGGGNQVGYDGRYYDPLGRTFYVRAAVKF
jgi:iron complex outermembrane recepter protein